MSDEIKSTFTLDELLAELAQGRQEDLSGYLTVGEWCTRLGTCRARMCALIKQGLARGIVKRARAQREGMDQVMRPVPVYAFVSKRED